MSACYFDYDFRYKAIDNSSVTIISVNYIIVEKQKVIVSSDFLKHV